MHVLKFVISLVTDKFIRLLTSTGIYHQPFIPWDEKSLIFTFLFYFRNGLPAEKQVEETRVWQRKDGKWQNIHIHRSENLSSPKKQNTMNQRFFSNCITELCIWTMRSIIFDYPMAKIIKKLDCTKLKTGGFKNEHNTDLGIKSLISDAQFQKHFFRSS